MKWKIGWVVLLGLPASPALAGSDNFDLNGKIYTKWLYRNNASQGVLSYGNPFWPENQSGDNGAGTEFELTVKGRVSEVVDAGARLKSRFGSTWHDFWENGNMRYGDEVNTSGESLGLDHAEYFKLRGYWVTLNRPFPGLDYLHVGSSDLSMFNAWTVGKIRYIDRDNAKGFFLHGRPLDNKLSYHAGVIALPKLWVGPNWSTGIGEETYQESRVVSPFWTQDWAYALKVQSRPIDRLQVELVGMISLDYEADLLDPDATGTLNPADADYCREHPDDATRCTDHAVDLSNRYTNAVVTLSGETEPVDDVVIHFLGGWSFNKIGGWNADQSHSTLVGNGVASNQGTFPVVYADVSDVSTVVRLSWLNAFGTDDLVFRFEGFYIGEHWTSTFGARREDDVLLTDGFIEGGQLPTLNLANEFVDFDEPFFESCIGWQGGTLQAEYVRGALSLKAETSFIGYNTNKQHRRVYECADCAAPAIYPTFLHSEGYTDVDLYDYANPRSVDRGRDPRSVYRENQDRYSVIGVLWLNYLVDVGAGLDVRLKLKQIYDEDRRDEPDARDGDQAIDYAADDYIGRITIGRLSLAYPLTDTLKLEVGGQVDWWDESNRDGSRARGYAWYQTTKVKPFVLLTFNYGGASLRYYLEYVYKDQWRGERDPEQFWGVLRSKAALEVSW